MVKLVAKNFFLLWAIILILGCAVGSSQISPDTQKSEGNDLALTKTSSPTETAYPTETPCPTETTSPTETTVASIVSEQENTIDIEKLVPNRNTEKVVNLHADLDGDGIEERVIFDRDKVPSALTILTSNEETQSFRTIFTKNYLGGLVEVRVLNLRNDEKRQVVIYEMYGTFAPAVILEIYEYDVSSGVTLNNNITFNDAIPAFIDNELYIGDDNPGSLVKHITLNESDLVIKNVEVFYPEDTHFIEYYEQYGGIALTTTDVSTKIGGAIKFSLSPYGNPLCLGELQVEPDYFDFPIVNGVVIAKKAGSTTISVTCDRGSMAEVSVTILER